MVFLVICTGAFASPTVPFSLALFASPSAAVTTRRLSFRAHSVTGLPVSLRILLAALFSRMLLYVIQLPLTSNHHAGDAVTIPHESLLRRASDPMAPAHDGTRTLS